MGLFSFIGWVISSFFDIVFEFVANIFVWILPSYMTVQMIKDEKKTVKYGTNYLCFWMILAVLWALEYTVLYFFCSMTFYRILRLIAVIWLQVDYCTNAATALALVKPMISREHEEKLAALLDNVHSEFEKHGGKAKEKLSNQFWGIVQQNYELIKDSVFNGMSALSKKAGSAAPQSPSNGEEKDKAAKSDGPGAETEVVQKKES